MFWKSITRSIVILPAAAFIILFSANNAMSSESLKQRQASATQPLNLEEDVPAIEWNDVEMANIVWED